MLGIALQQSLPFKISADALCDALRQLGQLGARGRLDPAKANRAGGVLDVHASRSGDCPSMPYFNLSSSAFASFKSAVSKPSVNQP